MLEKTCYSCKSTKPITEFYENSSMCLWCKETYDLYLQGERGAYNQKLAHPPSFCRTCWSCSLTKPLPEFYGNTSLCKVCRTEIILRFADLRGDNALLVFPASPYCDICESPRPMFQSNKWGLSWLCKACAPTHGYHYAPKEQLIPDAACAYCIHKKSCNHRIKIGLWVHCERPSMDALRRAFCELQKQSPKDVDLIRSAIKKVLRHIPKHILKEEEMSNEDLPFEVNLNL